jgi:hypothetical protein
LRFKRSNLAQAAQVSISFGELGRQKRLDDVPSHGRPYRSPTHANDIQVIVLNPLFG